MSRHSIAGFDPCHDVVVGWDWQSRTFFCQVRDLRFPPVDYTPIDRPGSLIFQVGTQYDEIQDLEDLKQAIAPYVILPDAVAQELRRELAATVLPKPLLLHQFDE